MACGLAILDAWIRASTEQLFENTRIAKIDRSCIHEGREPVLIGRVERHARFHKQRDNRWAIGNCGPV